MGRQKLLPDYQKEKAEVQSLLKGKIQEAKQNLNKMEPPPALLPPKVTPLVSPYGPREPQVINRHYNVDVKKFYSGDWIDGIVASLLFSGGFSFGLMFANLLRR